MRRAALGLALGLLSLAVPADAATTVRVCVTTGTATFSPALTTATGSGSVTFAYHYECVYANDELSAGNDDTGDSSVTYAWSGSCALATLSGGGITGALVGGVAGATVLLNAPSRTSVRAFALVPTDALGNPCAMRVATFANVGPDVIDL